MKYYLVLGNGANIAKVRFHCSMNAEGGLAKLLQESCKYHY